MTGCNGVMKRSVNSLMNEVKWCNARSVLIMIRVIIQVDYVSCDLSILNFNTPWQVPDAEFSLSSIHSSHDLRAL